MNETNFEKATVGGGCFWCIEAAFDLLEGVKNVSSGYTGGKIKNPTYREVCSGLTGHAEVIEITYDPEVLDFNKILEIFFTVHDPTTLNRQGADTGTQYRSAIFYHNEGQKQRAEEVIKKLTAENVFQNPITTEVTSLDTFYPAEAYHQDYYVNNSDQPYCSYVVKPKVEKIKQVFSELLKK